VGLYLPLETTTPIFVGGLLRHFRDKASGDKASETDNGVLFSSGLVAGVGVIGIFLAVTALIPMPGGNFLLDAMRLPLAAMWEFLPIGEQLSMVAAAIIFAILSISLFRLAKPRKK
jgi:hypothetical protein